MSMDTPAGFRRLDDGPQVQLCIDGRVLSVPAQATVAAALLVAGPGVLRTTVLSGAPRAPYCMMGVCFECLVEIDGRANRQACLETVAAGMQVRTQQGAPAFPHCPCEAKDER